VVGDEVDGEFDAERCNHFLERENGRRSKEFENNTEEKDAGRRGLGILEFASIL